MSFKNPMPAIKKYTLNKAQRISLKRKKQRDEWGTWLTTNAMKRAAILR